MTRRSLLVLSSTFFGALFAFSPAEAAKWTCSAPGLRNSSYSGGETAYVHLEGYNRGGHYKVTRNGNTATGQTANGTTFVCKAS